MTDKKKYEVSSIDEFIKTICTINERMMEKSKFVEGIDKLFFRGHSKQSYQLLPSIARIEQVSEYNKSFPTEINLLKYEGRIIQDALDRFPELNEYKEKPLELIAVLQHFGLPTRLLDITENALVALYFATKVNDNVDDKEDGEVICFCYNKSTYSQHWIYNAIAESYALCEERETNYESFLRKVKNRPYYLDDNSVVNEALKGDGFASIITADLMRNTLFGEVQLLEMRQRAQSGAYLLFSNEIKDGAFLKKIEPISKEKDSHIEGIITINKRQKAIIRQQLELMGISGITLFPDSKDIVFAEIKEEYKRNAIEKRRRLY